MSSSNSVRPQCFFTPGYIMRITIRAMCQTNAQILNCCSKLSKMCPAVLVLYICAKIQDASSKLFNHLYQIKAHKLDQLIGPQNTSDSSPESLKTAISIPGNLPISDSEQSVLSKRLIFVLISKKTVSDL